MAYLITYGTPHASNPSIRAFNKSRRGVVFTKKFQHFEPLLSRREYLKLKKRMKIARLTELRHGS